MTTIELKVINKTTGRVHYDEKIEIAHELAQALIERLEGLAAGLPVPTSIAKTVTPGGDTTLEVELNGYGHKPHLPSPTFEQIYRRALPPPTAVRETRVSRAAAGWLPVKESDHDQLA